MKKRNLWLTYFIFSACTIFAQDIGFIDEYKLLHTDLLNLFTWGYKSFYNNERNSTEETISLAHGSLMITDNIFDWAIVGDGFFKIRLNDGSAGYMRCLNLTVNGEGILITNHGYELFDSINLSGNYLMETIKITSTGSVYITKYDETGKTTEIRVGQLLTYRIPAESLKHYHDAIYVIKDNAEYTEELMPDNNIVQGALEMSNYYLLPVVLRMYYILSVLGENEMPNIAFKRELLKIQIEKMAHNDNISAARFTMPSNTYSVQDYIRIRNSYLSGILPFIKYDY